MEEGIFQEISDFVYQIPIPFAEFYENVVVASLEDVEMGLRLDCSSEKRFQKDLIFSLGVNRKNDDLRFCLFGEKTLEML